MNRDDVLRMAREAGMNLTPAQFSGVLEDEIDEFKLAAFAALVAAAEREACAQTAAATTSRRRFAHKVANRLLSAPECDVAAAIRARASA